MSETPRPLPPQGWYPDQLVPGRMRHWTGTAWSEQVAATGYGPAVRAPLPVRPGFARLSNAIVIGLGLSVLVSLFRAGLYLWGRSIFEGSVSAGDLGPLHTFDNLDRATSIVGALVFLVTGVLWLIWQYKLAQVTNDGELRRGLGWQVGSWFIPFGGLWMVPQNHRDLWKRFLRTPSAAVIGWWWAAFLVSQLIERIGSSLATDADTVDAFTTGLDFSIASEVVQIGAAVLAVRIVQKLTYAGAAESAELRRGANPVG